MNRIKLQNLQELDYEKLVSSTKLHGATEGTARVEVFFSQLSTKNIFIHFLKIVENSSSRLLTPHCLQIYFMSLNVKAIKETARYSLATFIATIGGSMGAWVGFSVCMIFEVKSFFMEKHF